STAVVAGAGAVGILGALVLAAARFETHVWSLEPESGPQATLLASAGGRYVGAERQPPAPLRAPRRRGGVPYQATRGAAVAFQALAALGHNGVLVLTGLPGGRRPLEIDAAALMRNLVLRNQLVLGTINASPDAFGAAIRDLAVFESRWPGVARAVIIGRFPLDAHGALLQGPAGGIKSVIAMRCACRP